MRAIGARDRSTTGALADAPESEHHRARTRRVRRDDGQTDGLPRLLFAHVMEEVTTARHRHAVDLDNHRLSSDARIVNGASFRHGNGDDPVDARR